MPRYLKRLILKITPSTKLYPAIYFTAEIRNVFATRILEIKFPVPFSLIIFMQLLNAKKCGGDYANIRQSYLPKQTQFYMK